MHEVGHNLMMQYLAYTRAVHIWFHGAHHCVRGVSFSGDHVNLFGKIYDEVQDSYDGAAEKAIGIFDESVADPCAVTTMAAHVMSKYPSPCELSSAGIAKAGLQLIGDYLAFVEHAFETLEDSGELTLGLNDFLASSANNLESYVYLLKQRVKEDEDF
jgi:DNA-binding ferritin-like protein